MAEPFPALCLAYGLPCPVPEYGFHPTRQWRFDWCFPAPLQIALEVEGGIWTRGRHTRARGFEADLEKYNEAAILGWTVLRCTPQQMANGAILDVLRRAVEAQGRRTLANPPAEVLE